MTNDKIHKVNIMRQTHLIPTAERSAITNAAKFLMIYTVLGMSSGAAFADSAAYPGATATQGTALNNVYTASALQAAPAAAQAAAPAPIQPQAQAAAPASNTNTPSSSRGFFGRLLSSNTPETPVAAQAAPVAPQATAPIAANVAANDAVIAAPAPVTAENLGEPDSSPAMFAAREELEASHTEAAPAATTAAAEQPAATMDSNAQAMAAAPQAPAQAPIQTPAQAVMAAAPSATGATITNDTIANGAAMHRTHVREITPMAAPMPASTQNMPQAQAAAPQPLVSAQVNAPENTQVAATAAHPDHVMGTPDDSPAQFSDRRELNPVKDPGKLHKVLSSLLTPITGEQAAAPADTKDAPQLASYESPGAVIKKETLKQAQLQPNLTENEVRMASLTPAAGDGKASDSAPLIQLPAVPPPVVPGNPGQEVLTPKTAPTTADAGEPRRELSPATKAVIKKIPPHVGQSAKTKSSPIDIDHARSPNMPDGTVATDAVKHEEMGIKIEVKSPKIDLNYELEKAYNALNAGQTETAMDIYKNILANDPNNKAALFALGTLYHRAGQLDAARKLYSKLLTVDPNNRDALNNFLVLMADEAPEAALDQLGKLEQRDPKFSPIPAQMAIIYEKMGNMDMASEKMFRAIDLAPENLLYRYNLAIMLDKQRKYDEAGKLYRQIVEAYQRGETTPGNIQQIKQRLIYISSAKP